MIDEHVPATVTVDTAAERTWDVLVIGAGPAGAVAARELAATTNVLLVDRARFPRSKVCGCCLNGAALQTLEAIGLGALATDCGAIPLREFRLANRRRVASVPLREGVSLSRERLDTELVKAAIEAGADFLDNTQALIQAEQPDGISVELKRERQTVVAAAKQVIIAGGLGCRAFVRSEIDARRATRNSRVGAGATLVDASSDFEDGTIYMACHRSGYVGLTRLEDGRLDIAAALDTTAIKQQASTSVLVEEILRDAGLTVPPGLTEATWQGTAKLTQQRTRVAGDRYSVVGDAAGYVEPFTGEGMAWALATGRAVAPFLKASLGGDSTGPSQGWTAKHRELLGRRMRLCRSVSLLLRYPVLVGTAVRLLAVAPGLARPFVRSLNAPLKPDR
jgi:flavin-dependent dehydrogenase